MIRKYKFFIISIAILLLLVSVYLFFSLRTFNAEGSYCFVNNRYSYIHVKDFDEIITWLEKKYIKDEFNIIAQMENTSVLDDVRRILKDFRTANIEFSIEDIYQILSYDSTFVVKPNFAIIAKLPEKWLYSLKEKELIKEKKILNWANYFVYNIKEYLIFSHDIKFIKKIMKVKRKGIPSNSFQKGIINFKKINIPVLNIKNASFNGMVFLKDRIKVSGFLRNKKRYKPAQYFDFEKDIIEQNELFAVFNTFNANQLIKEFKDDYVFDRRLNQTSVAVLQGLDNPVKSFLIYIPEKVNPISIHLSETNIIRRSGNTISINFNFYSGYKLRKYNPELDPLFMIKINLNKTASDIPGLNLNVNYDMLTITGMQSGNKTMDVELSF